VPSAFPRTSLHILRKHKPQSLHLREEQDFQGTPQGTTTEQLLSHSGRSLQWAWVCSYVPGLLARLADHVLSASKRSIALDVQ